MKKAVFSIIVLLMVCGISVGGVYSYRKSIDDAYVNAVAFIQNGSYEEALAELEKANPNMIERSNFKWDMKHNKPDKYYKNTVYLYSYAMAQNEYNSENRYMHTVNEYLELIPTDYIGELAEEIGTFKGNFQSQYDECLEKERLQTEENERQFYANLKTKLPYEGMNEKYIDLTMMGKHDKAILDDAYDDFVYNLYYWKTNSGDTLLAVTCINGEVKSVTKYGEGYFWTADGRPDYNGKKPYTSSKNKIKSKKTDDRYNVKDYSDPEDFYDDNYDDFFDYEDAEDYYYEHCE